MDWEPPAPSGIDPTSAEEVAKARARAARFELPQFDGAAERARLAGLPGEVGRLRREGRARAARFGGEADELDTAVARAALQALGPAESDYSAGPLPADWVANPPPAEGDGIAAPIAPDAAPAPAPLQPLSAEDAATVAARAAEEADPMAAEVAAPVAAPVVPSTPAELRSAAIHVRAYRYLPAASKDIAAFFHPLRPSRIEWLGGVSVNVLFADDATAARALELFGEPIPRVAGIAGVHPAWRCCLKPLVKLETDKYAPAGAETTLWIRRAGSYDTRALVPPSHGPRWHGTYSAGAFSAGAVANRMDAPLSLPEADPMDLARAVGNRLHAAADAISGGGGGGAGTWGEMSSGAVGGGSGVAYHPRTIVPGSNEGDFSVSLSRAPTGGVGASAAAAAAPSSTGGVTVVKRRVRGRGNATVGTAVGAEVNFVVSLGGTSSFGSNMHRPEDDLVAPLPVGGSGGRLSGKRRAREPDVIEAATAMEQEGAPIAALASDEGRDARGGVAGGIAEDDL